LEFVGGGGGVVVVVLVLVAVVLTCCCCRAHLLLPGLIVCFAALLYPASLCYSAVSRFSLHHCHIPILTFSSPSPAIFYCRHFSIHIYEIIYIHHHRRRHASFNTNHEHYHSPPYLEIPCLYHPSATI
jgi:hypothetical protein